jgi:hypothetical protein
MVRRAWRPAQVMAARQAAGASCSAQVGWHIACNIGAQGACADADMPWLRGRSGRWTPTSPAPTSEYADCGTCQIFDMRAVDEQSKRRCTTAMTIDVNVRQPPLIGHDGLKDRRR